MVDEKLIEAYAADADKLSNFVEQVFKDEKPADMDEVKLMLLLHTV